MSKGFLEETSKERLKGVGRSKPPGVWGRQAGKGICIPGYGKVRRASEPSGVGKEVNWRIETEAWSSNRGSKEWLWLSSGYT